MSEVLKRLKNPATITGIASAVLIIATNSGLVVDNEKVMAIINAMCFIGVSLGLLNDPTTPGMDNIFISNNKRES